MWHFDLPSSIAPPLIDLECSNSARKLRLDKTLQKNFSNVQKIPYGTQKPGRFGFFKVNYLGNFELKMSRFFDARGLLASSLIYQKILNLIWLQNLEIIQNWWFILIPGSQHRGWMFEKSQPPCLLIGDAATGAKRHLGMSSIRF